MVDEIIRQMLSIKIDSTGLTKRSIAILGPRILNQASVYWSYNVQTSLNMIFLLDTVIKVNERILKPIRNST